MRLWGVGNHGGGPSDKDLHDIEALIERYRGRVEIFHSVPEAYFSELIPECLPSFRRDLNPIFVGCYTSLPAVKQLNRLLESRLFLAEKMATQAMRNGLVHYPSAALGEAERDLLFCQFHDILAGACVQSAEKNTLRKLSHGLQICDDVVTSAFFALAQGQPKAREDTIPILLYNPHPVPVTGVFSCEYMLPDQNWSDLCTDAELYDGEERLPSQLEKEQSNINLDWRKKITFFATLPPMSIKRLECRMIMRPFLPRPIRALTEDLPLAGDGGRLRLRLSAAEGLPRDLTYDGRTVSSGGFGQLCVFRDSADPWEMKRLKMNEEAGRFRLMSPEEAAVFTHRSDRPDGGFQPVRILEDGEVRTVIEALFAYGSSSARVAYALSKHSPTLDIDVTLYWNEKDALLRLRFPHHFTAPKYSVQDMFGVKTVPADGMETVGQRWALLAGEEDALCILSDISYGYMADAESLYCNLVRSPAYTAHPIPNRPLLPDECFSHRSGQGEWHFHFRVVVGAPDSLAASCETEAQAFLEMPPALPLFSTTYDQPAYVNHPICITGAVMTAMKKAVSGDGIVLRLYNPRAVSSGAVLKMDGLRAEIPFGPYEVKTYRLEDDRLTEISLLEMPLEAQTAEPVVCAALPSLVTA